MRAPLLLAAAVSLLPAAALAQGAAQAPPAPAAPPAAPAQAARPVLGLDEAVRTALAHQPQLRQAQANREAAEARSESARAPLLPQLRGSAGVDWATHNLPATSPSYTAARTVNASAVATQVLFDAAQLQRWRSSLASASALEASERAAALQIAASTRAAFFAARAARDLVAVARESLANEDAHLKQVQAFVQVGTRPEIDLAQARAARANAQVQVIQAENAYDTARAQLVQAMGVVRATDFDIGDDVLPAVPGEDQPLDPLFAEALASRPELVSFGEQERAQTLARSAARAGYLPTVGAEADVSRGLASTLPDGASNWGASVTLTWNLFQGGATRAAVREAEANLTALSAQDEQFRQQIRLDVEQARLAVRASRATLGSAGEAETAARERLRLAEGRYRAGAGSIIELGDAQVAASSAAAQRVQSEFNLAASRAQLLRALGRLNP
jgi:outer membrane protein